MARHKWHLVQSVGDTNDFTVLQTEEAFDQLPEPGTDQRRVLIQYNPNQPAIIAYVLDGRLMPFFVGTLTATPAIFQAEVMEAS